MKGRDRRLGRLNQLFAHLDLICNANSCDWIELESAPDLAVLTRAIEHVIDRHPMARSIRYQRGPTLRWRHLDERLPVRVETRISPLTDPGRLRAELLQLVWSARVPSHDGHPLRFIYTRTPDRHILQIITTHIFTDGKAATLLAGDIAECYGALLAGEPWDSSVVDLPERDHERLFLAGISWRRALALSWRAARGLLHDLLAPVSRVALRTPRSGETDVLMCELPESMLGTLKQVCSQRSLTLHPLLLLAVLRTVQHDAARQGQPLRQPLRVVDNFSLRRFVDDPRMERLYDCVSVPYTLELHPDQDDASVLRNASAHLDELKRGGILSELYRFKMVFAPTAWLPKKPMMRLACEVLTRASVICTNVGPLDTRLERFGPIAVRSYFSFPQLLPPGQVMYQISAFRGRLRLVLLYDRGQMDEAAARRRFVAPFVAELERLGASVHLPTPTAPLSPAPAPALA